MEPISEPTEQPFAIAQFEQAVQTFRTQFTLAIQLISLLTIANITIAGYALTEKIAGVLFMAPLFPILIMLVFSKLPRWMLPIVYTAICIEYKFKMKGFDWLATTFAGLRLSPEIVSKLQRISTIKDDDEKQRELKTTEFFPKKSKRLVNFILISIVIIQMLVGIGLHYIFSWRIF